MIAAPINDVSCLSKFTDVAQQATERAEVQQLAERFLARNRNTDSALRDMRRWLRNKPQLNDTGHGPEPRVDCGTVQQRVNYLGDRPNCSERTILYCALGEQIDPDSIRQMATIKTPAGLHTFPLENGDPIVLDPRMPRNALLLGVHAMRNGAGATEMQPHELVSFALDLAEEPARQYRNGRTRIDNAEHALQRIFRGERVAPCPSRFRNALSDIAWTFALAEQAARVSGGYGLDAVRLSAMAVQSMMTAQARNLSFHVGGYKIGVDTKALRKVRKHIGRASKDVLRTAEHVAKAAGPLAGPALKAYLLTNGIPPQAVDAIAGTVLQSAGIAPGPLGFKTPDAGSLNALAFDTAVQQLAKTAPKKG